MLWTRARTSRLAQVRGLTPHPEQGGVRSSRRRRDSSSDHPCRQPSACFLCELSVVDPIDVVRPPRPPLRLSRSRHRPRAPFLKFARRAAARANIKRARPTSSLISLLGRPARLPSVPMTATSALSASSPNSFPDLADRTVLLPGSPATYANRAYLRALGLRWNPERHQWHGTTTAGRVRVLREQFGLEVRCFGTLELPHGPSPPRPSVPTPTAARTLQSVPVSTPRRRDGSRTHAEARSAYHAEEEVGANSRFSEWDITSGLPDDSREAGERQEARRLRELRARVKVARAVASTTPGVAETLRGDWQKAARFYARFGITEARFRHGVTG
jgi:hypothetical protein